jgi:hypothetical protein
MGRGPQARIQCRPAGTVRSSRPGQHRALSVISAVRSVVAGLTAVATISAMGVGSGVRGSSIEAGPACEWRADEVWSAPNRRT